MTRFTSQPLKRWCQILAGMVVTLSVLSPTPSTHAAVEEDFLIIGIKDSDRPIQRIVHDVARVAQQNWQRLAKLPETITAALQSQGAEPTEAQVKTIIDEALEKGFEHRVEGFGSSKITKVKRSDGTSVLVNRVLHEETNSAVIIMPQSLYLDSGPGVRAFLSRQYIDASQPKITKRKKRAVYLSVLPDEMVRIAETSEILESLRYKQGPGVLSWQHWKEVFWSTYVKPSKRNKNDPNSPAGDLEFGIFCGILQAMVATLVVGMQNGLHALLPELIKGKAFDPFPVAMTFAFGTIIGVNIKTYRNIMARGSQFTKFLKTLSISLAFAIPIKFFHETGWLGDNLWAHVTGISLLVLNLYFNNKSKVSLQNIATDRKEMRMNLGNADRKMAGMTFPQRLVEDQIYLFLPFNNFPKIFQLLNPVVGLPVLVLSPYVTDALRYLLNRQWNETRTQERGWGYAEWPEIRDKWERKPWIVRKPLEACANIFVKINERYRFLPDQH